MENNLLTPEEIESAGFIYEPDESKCHMTKIRMHFDCNYYSSGSWTDRTTPEITSEWKEECKKAMLVDARYWSHIHKVFVPEVSPLSGQGVMCRWVMIDGYGTELAKKWHKTGLLEGLKPKQLPEAAAYLNRISQELIGTNPVVGTQEYDKKDKLAGIVIPIARLMFDQKYPNHPDPKWLNEDIEKFFDKNQELYEELKGGIAQDQDHQFQKLYWEEYESRTPQASN